MLVRDQFTKKESELLAYKVMVWISCKLTGKVSSISGLRRLSVDREHLPEICKLLPPSSSSPMLME